MMYDMANMEDVNLSKPIILFIDTGGLTNGGGNWSYPKHKAEAIRASIEDVAAPVPYEVPCGDDKNNCWNDEQGNEPDGILDLSVKFKTNHVIKAIEAATGTAVKDGDLYCVTILAKKNNNENGYATILHGTDTIWIKKGGEAED